MSDRVAETAKLRRGFADTAYGQVHYAEIGSGEPLVLLHQSAQSWRIYARLAAVLATTHRVVAMDLPGFGDSVPLPEPYEVADVAAMMLGAADSLGLDTFFVSGHHTGATVAGELAAAHPERIRAVVSSGYLYRTPEEHREAVGRIASQRDAPISPRFNIKLDGSHLWRSYERITLRRWQSKLSGMRVEPPLPQLVLPFDQVQQDPAHTLDDGDLELINESIVDNLRAALHGAGAMNRAVTRYDAHERLPLITVPMLVVQSSGPWEQPLLQRAEAVAGLIPGGQFATIEHGDIFVPHSRVDEYSRLLLDFFGAVAP